ncbi:hypothetical protein [Spelaeicoccus albus]|uniref:Uncharacterized protein n=1 Tax=Spelaeicoccus albus TaxID=1280376 RepID=A0A7Z0IIU7_9MICO|nr:hypothetical protein [Spelaeicoccus albus]NYI68839.1 hypothetical protein [Spelaeicoccus albus]
MTDPSNEPDDEPITGEVIDDGSAAGESTRGLAAQIVQMLYVTVQVARIPLMLVILLPVVPALVALAFGFVLGGGWLLAAAIIFVVGLASPALLWVQRRSAIKSVEDPDDLTTEVARALDLPGAFGDAGRAVRGVRSLHLGSGNIFGRMRRLHNWFAGATDVVTRFTEFPKLRPFLPPRLMFTWYFTLASAIGAAVFVVFAIIEIIALIARLF